MHGVWERPYRSKEIIQPRSGHMKTASQNHGDFRLQCFSKQEEKMVVFERYVQPATRKWREKSISLINSSRWTRRGLVKSMKRMVTLMAVVAVVIAEAEAVKEAMKAREALEVGSWKQNVLMYYNYIINDQYMLLKVVYMYTGKK